MQGSQIRSIGIALTRLVAIAALCVLPAAAAGPGVWGEIAVPVFQSDRVLGSMTVEFRSDEVFPRNTFVGRYTTLARFPVSRSWSLRVGYSSFLRGNDFVRLGWQRALNAGVSYPLGTPKLIGSTIYEHHWLPADLGARNRLRQRFEFTWRRAKVAPWAYEDLTMENGRGLYRSRSRVGLSFDLPGAWQLRTSYQFQALKRPTSGAWAPRHAILLQLRLPPLFDRRTKQRKVKQPQPDQTTEELEEE